MEDTTWGMIEDHEGETEYYCPVCKADNGAHDVGPEDAYERMDRLARHRVAWGIERVRKAMAERKTA